MHFFNPVPVMGLVEIIKTEATSEETFVALKQYGSEVGKKVVSCRDTPGFVRGRCKDMPGNGTGRQLTTRCRW